MKIYADNAATTKMRKCAIDAMLPYYDGIYANPSSLHTPGQIAAEAVRAARERMAAAIGCLPREIYFTSGGSESDNWAIASAAEAGARKNKKHIISCAIEHHAVLHTLNKLEKRGYEITLLPVSENGIVRAEDVEASIRTDTALVTIMFANNEIGTIQPIAEIGKICRDKGVTFHTDAVQAVGHIGINVKEQNIDMLSLSAHKFGGPKGIGALYIRSGLPVTNLIDGGAQERGKRAGTENVPAIVGMAAALDECLKDMNKDAAKLIKLRDRLIDGLLKIPHTALNGDRSSRLPGNVNVCFEGIEGESLLLLLDAKGVYASSGSACTSGSLDPSHVLLAIGRPHSVAHGSLRLTLSADATEKEIDYIINAVTDVVAYLRNMSPVWHDLLEGKAQYVIQ